MSESQLAKFLPGFLKGKKRNIIILVVFIALCVIFNYKIMIPTVLLFIFGIVTIFSRKLLRKRHEHSAEISQVTLDDEQTQIISKYFISKDEKYISSLGNGYIVNYIATDSLSKGFAVMSDQRVYFCGNRFSGQGRALCMTDEERTVDIKDVIGCGFIYKQYTGILLGLTVALTVLFSGAVIAGLFTIQGGLKTIQTQDITQVWETPIDEINSNDDSEKSTFSYFLGTVSTAMFVGIFAPFIISCFLALLDYLKKRRTMFEIQYAGGCVAFDVSYYAKAEIEDFRKKLRRTKYLTDQSNNPHGQDTSAQAHQTVEDNPPMGRANMQIS